MRTIALILFTAASITANAQTAKERVSEWIRHNFVDRNIFEFYGQTVEDGRPCGLFLTYLDNGHPTYIVVGNSDRSGNDDDYVGIDLSESVKNSLTSTKLYSESKTTWGNHSTYNQVTVDLNEQGEPYRATGISDVKKITCVIKGTGEPVPAT